MPIDPDWAKLGWDFFQTSLLGVIAVHQWVVSRDRVRRQQIANMEADLREHLEAHERRITRAEEMAVHGPTMTMCHDTRQRLARLEQANDGGPTHRDLNALNERVHEGLARTHERMDRVEAAVSALSGEMGSQNRLLQTVVDHLVDATKR